MKYLQSILSISSLFSNFLLVENILILIIYSTGKIIFIENIFNEYMRSQYYKQIELDTFPKKTSAHQQAKRKIINDTAAHNAQTHSRNHRSEKRTMINSIDLMRKSKQDNEHKMKMSYSKPTLQIQNEAGKYDAQWIDLKCLDCESLRMEQGKRLKELQMLYEQELTEEKEKYIMMEKKYLLKENQYIKLMAEFGRMEHAYAQIDHQNQSLRISNSALEGDLRTVERQHEKLTQENKSQAEKIQSLHYFLKLYVEQTKIVINWAHLFEQIQEQLPTLMHVIKEDLLIRRMDFQITLKEAAIFQKLNFSQITSNKEEPSAFLDDSGCQNFMKYLKQEAKPNPFRQQASAKKGNSFIDSLNKQNIDYINGIPIKSLLNSRVKDKSKHRLQPIMNDDCLRLLLLQAKTIESSIDIKADSLKESSRINMQDFSSQTSIRI